MHIFLTLQYICCRVKKLVQFLPFLVLKTGPFLFFFVFEKSHSPCRKKRIKKKKKKQKKDPFLPWAICRNVSEDFCSINFGGFCRGFSRRIFLGTFSHKNEEKKSGEKIREKIRRLKNKNPRKIRSAESRPQPFLALKNWSNFVAQQYLDQFVSSLDQF